MDFGAFNFSFNSSALADNGGLQWYQCWPTLFMFLVSEMFNTLLGLFTNIWVLALILKDWRNQVVQEIFTINLGMLEIIYCLLSQVLLLNYVLLKITCIYEYNWCVYGLSFFGRSLFQCGMCLERYVAVVHPTFFFRHNPLKCRVIFLIVGWFFTALFIWLIFTNPTINPVVGLFTFVVSVNLFCSLRILRVLRQPSPGAGGGKKEKEMNLKKKRAYNTVVIIQANAMLNYVPLVIMPRLRLQMDPYTLTCVYQPFAISCCLMGSFLQPLIFLHRTGKLQWPGLKNSPCK